MPVLFDLDGTLVDSGRGIRASVRHATAVAGIAEPTDEQLRALVGPPFPDAFVDVLGVDPATAEVMMRAYRDVYGATGLYDVSVYPGIERLLAGLLDTGATPVLTTSKPEPYAREVLRHVGLLRFFAGGVFGASLDGSVAGKAAVVGLALDAAPAGAASVLVGDRSHDVEGAGAHGIPCIGVSWGFGGRTELEEAGAATVVDSPAALASALAGHAAARSTV